MQPHRPGAREPVENFLSDFRGDHADDDQRGCEADAEYYDSSQAEHDFPLRKCIEQDGKCSRVGQQTTGDAKPDQHPQAWTVGGREFQIVRVLEAPAVAVKARFLVMFMMVGMRVIIPMAVIIAMAVSEVSAVDMTMAVLVVTIPMIGIVCVRPKAHLCMNW